MRITEIKVKTVSIASEIRNAFIDFSKMTVSVAALHTDIIKNGKPALCAAFDTQPLGFLLKVWRVGLWQIL